jgi:glycosyltransferase involved in cell wall biosynthesis
VTAAGLAEGRVRALGQLDDRDLSVALARATIFVYPTLTNGFGMPMLEAFKFGTPVIHSDTPSLLEVSGDAGVSVPAGDRETYPGLLAEAITTLATDEELRRQLGVLGSDRAKVFTWRAAAEAVWQLHADL